MDKTLVTSNHLRKISIRNFAVKVKVNPVISINNFIISCKSTETERLSIHNESSHIIEGSMLIFCTRGKAKFKVNLIEYSIEKNTILTIIPNSILELIEKSDDFEIEFVFYTFDFISNLKLIEGMGKRLSMIEAQPCLILDDNDFEDFLYIHKMMVQQCLSLNIYRDDLVKSHLSSMLYRLLQLYKTIHQSIATKKIGREDVIYKKFISLLFQYYSQERSVSFYADKLNLTPKYFSKVIKNVSQISAGQRIDEMVIMGAKMLLKGSEFTIFQISEELNFPNPSFFTTYFKSKTGMTPKQYRSNLS